MGKMGKCKGQLTSNLRERWTDPITARRVPSKWKRGTKENKGSKGNCSVSRWRPQKVDKRMVLEYTHGLFIT
jgi:hypothetical protein